MEKITANTILSWKGRRKIPALTAYDYAMARLLDEAGVPLLLVGDSLGMVVLGYEDTTHVTMEEMEHHVRAVARARPNALVVADLPFGACETADLALENARRLVAAGAEAVKAEGGQDILPQIEAIVAAGIPFLAHLGMLPQHVREEGGYHIKGREEQERTCLLEDARAVSEAGAFAVVLELVAAPVAAELTATVRIPTIGIGSGGRCDGQILVTTDLWRTSPGYIPKHAGVRRDLKVSMRQTVQEWQEEVMSGSD